MRFGGNFGLSLEHFPMSSGPRPWALLISFHEQLTTNRFKFTLAHLLILGCLEDHTDHTVKSLHTVSPEKKLGYSPYGRRSHTVHTVDHTVTPKNV